MPVLTIGSYILKRVNKALAPQFLHISLRAHEFLSSSALPPSLNALSMLPVAQRLVSIEVQDEYRQLTLNAKSSGSAQDTGITSQISNAWESFVDQTWNVFFESRHQRLKAEEDLQMKSVEEEVQRQMEIKQHKGRQNRDSSFNQRTKELYDKDEQTAQLIELGERRVQVLDQYLRPALFPSSSPNDLSRPLFQHDNAIQNNNHDSFVKWIRGEYLIAKYGPFVQRAVRRYPQLKDDAAGLSSGGVVAGTQTIDGEEVEVPLDMILPSVNDVRDGFEMEGWSQVKAPYSSLDSDDDETDMQIADATIDHVIHHQLRGQIAHSGPLNAYFEMRRREDSYELWTKDYIFGLANYLLKRIEEMDRQSTTQSTTHQLETIVLDVGAGDGRLIYFLRRALKEIMSSSNSSQVRSIPKSSRQPKRKATPKRDMNTQHQSTLPTLIATDDGSWKAPIFKNKHIQVEQLSADAALQKYGPSSNEEEAEKRTRLIVLCSWMPPGVDWTRDFRHNGLVEEYILIGESDDGTCGHNWLTWGNADFNEQFQTEQREGTNDGGTQKGNDVIAPYLADGYELVELQELSLLQFSRFDCRRSRESRTVSFRRGSGKS